jgi:hypothetical protein
MANYPSELAQNAVCQSHTGHLIGMALVPAKTSPRAEYYLIN